MKRIAAILLAVLLIFCILPVSALAEPETVTVTFYDYNNTELDTQTFTAGESKNLKSDYPSREDYVFLYWKDNNDVRYLPGRSTSFNADTDLVAVYGDQAHESEGICAQYNGESVVELPYNGEYQQVTFEAVKTKGQTYSEQDEIGYYMFDKWNLVLYDAKWYISLSGFNLGRTEAGISSTPYQSHEYCKTWVGGVIQVSDRYVSITPGTLKIYYLVTYDMNGGTGNIESQRFYGQDGPDPVLSDVIPTRDGYIFKGWATDATATEAKYQPGEKIDLNDNLDLYAVWVQPAPDTGFDSHTLLMTIIAFYSVMIIAAVSFRRKLN